MTRSEIKARAKAQLGGGIFTDSWVTALLVCLLQSVLMSVTAAIGVGLGGLLVAGPLSFGLSYLFLKQARDGQKMEIADLFKGFTDDFAQNFLISLLSSIFIVLWSLLFVIPGIVKTYAYSMAYYVKADHPDYNWRQCLDESMALTSGHKWDLFVLDLSFLGWYIVGALCFGIGTLFVIPYYTACRAQYYDGLKNARV